MFLPQWRFYFRKNDENLFNGFYAGVSTAYMRDYFFRTENTEKRHVLGIGALMGYQQVIKKKLSIGFTPAIHYGASFSTTTSAGYQERDIEPTFTRSWDFHIEYIF